MSKFVFLAIACGSMAAGAGLAAWPQEAMPTEREAGPAAIEGAPPVADGPWPAADRVPVAELDFESDTTGLLLESRTVDQLLDGASAASAEPLDPADRERLAMLLRTDPELRKQFRE